MTMEEGKGEGVGEEQQQQHQGGIQVDVVEEVEQQQSPLLSTPLPPPPLVAPPPLVSASGESKRGDRREDEEEIWSGGSEEEPYFTFSPSSLPPECYDTVDGGRAGSSCPSWVGSSTTYDPAQPFAPYGIAERIASFLSVKDIAAYLALDEKAQWGYESYTTIRDILDYLLGSLSLLRLLEWGLGTAGRLAHGSVMLVVTCVRGVGNGIHAVYAHIMATLSYFLRLGLALWRELRSLSLRELVRALLLLLTDKLERDVTGRESSSMGSRSSSHHGLGLGGSSKGPLLGSAVLKMPSFFNSFKELDEPAQGEDEAGEPFAFLSGAIPQLNAGLGRPSSKMGLVVSYREKNETLSSLTKQKVRRMMHYQVPLKPFEATIRCANKTAQLEDDDGTYTAGGGSSTSTLDRAPSSSFRRSSSLFPSVMCTPQSFPPTPISRACVMARFSQFSDDIVYLARDQLRLEELVKADDDVTKMAAQSLKQQACLAVFNSEDTATGIVLSCGGHCATKVGTTGLYTSTRAMVPIMRNRHVFFQMSIMAEESAVASLCIGLSTPEMPLNTLVGSWKYSIGFCSTGQILVGSRWYGSSTKQYRFGCGCTIGVLIHIDECRSSESWDGELVEASLKFSVNGMPVLLDATDGHPGGDVTPLFIPKDDDIYPTLTLHSPSTQVLGRFCAADILHPHRSLVGAPLGVPVYALDGSVILKPDQDVGTSNI